MGTKPTSMLSSQSDFGPIAHISESVVPAHPAGSLLTTDLVVINFQPHYLSQQSLLLQGFITCS